MNLWGQIEIKLSGITSSFNSFQTLSQGKILPNKLLVYGMSYMRMQQELAGQLSMRNNMPDTRGKDARSCLVSTRGLVETVIGQLTEQFNTQKDRAHSLWYLTDRITRKASSHTVAVMINKSLENPLLQFEKMVLMKS